MTRPYLSDRMMNFALTAHPRCIYRSIHGGSLVSFAAVGAPDGVGNVLHLLVQLGQQVTQLSPGRLLHLSLLDPAVVGLAMFLRKFTRVGRTFCASN